ncbi:hypothetical protein [uncultured Parabacteroides sp.]|uniref:hypothetical protein n=1 Tax=uncultured Parabacteroides sp. TaxID=512312 RepID=UPI00258A0E7D|nr:hypothetical protein [uncultured Parabacteroides sp.]
MWGRSLLVSVGLLVVLLPGCSAGRRSVQHREIREEVHSVHNDSLLLKNLYQASRNKVIDIEHVVFDSCRSDGVQSVTHVAIKEQGEEVVESVVSFGSVDENCFAGSDSFQKGSIVEFSYPKRMLVIGGVVCLLYIGIAFRKRK